MKSIVEGKGNAQDVLTSIESLDTLPAPSDPGFEEMMHILAAYLDELVRSDYYRLLSILYRIDVSETKLKSELKQNIEKETPGYTMARLVIAKLQEKLYWKKVYSKRGETEY